MLNIHDLKFAYEEAIGRPTSDSTVYSVLNRHDWRKLSLAPFIPTKTSRRRKKGFAEAVRKAKRIAAKHGRRLRITFADEARFGRRNHPRPCWAPPNVRPAVASQLIRECIYLYGAVSPMDGACCFLILPAADTECFQIFLNTLSKRFSRHHILLVLDGAPNHTTDDLLIPANITLEFLPP